MKKNEMMLITNLRKNGRMPLTELSRITSLPVSTLHEKLKQQIQNGVLKPTALVNFEKIGYNTRAYILLSVEQDEKEKLYEQLKKNRNVNTLCRVNNGWSIIMECVFKDMYSLEDFVEKIEKNFHIRQKQVHYVLAEFKREEFLAMEEGSNI